MSAEHRRFTCTVGKKQLSESLVDCVNDGDFTDEEVVVIVNKLILHLYRKSPSSLFHVWKYLKPRFERYLNST